MSGAAYKLTNDQRGWLLRWRSATDHATGLRVVASWNWTEDGRVEIHLKDGGKVTSTSRGVPR